MKSEKEKLAAKSVLQLKAAAKRLGGKLVTPDGKAKTKQQLINTIVMKNRLAGKSMGAKQTGTSNKAKDLQKKAMAPGKRISKTGKAYTETRKNRSDVPPGLLGDNIKYKYISAETWRKTPKDYKTVINGVKYKMFLDEAVGTILAPVKIKKQS
jgi:hypothetical protein